MKAVALALTVTLAAVALAGESRRRPSQASALPTTPMSGFLISSQSDLTDFSYTLDIQESGQAPANLEILHVWRIRSGVYCRVASAVVGPNLPARFSIDTSELQVGDLVLIELGRGFSVALLRYGADGREVGREVYESRAEREPLAVPVGCEGAL